MAGKIQGSRARQPSARAPRSADTEFGGGCAQGREEQSINIAGNTWWALSRPWRSLLNQAVASRQPFCR